MEPKLKKYFLTVTNEVHPDLCERIRRHTFTSRAGDNWLTPELQRGYGCWEAARRAAGAACPFPNVKFWSVRCYRRRDAEGEEPELVSGDFGVGVSCGAVG